MTPSRALLASINKLRECFGATTAALAPYPVTPVDKPGKWRVVGEGPWGLRSENGHAIKCTFRSYEQAVKECARLNGEG